MALLDLHIQRVTQSFTTLNTDKSALNGETLRRREIPKTQEVQGQKCFMGFKIKKIQTLFFLGPRLKTSISSGGQLLVFDSPCASLHLCVSPLKRLLRYLFQLIPPLVSCFQFSFNVFKPIFQCHNHRTLFINIRVSHFFVDSGLFSFQSVYLDW